MRALGIVGRSGSGKTTLIEALVPRFKADGYTVGVVKQSHHDVEVDVPGKDSWRHRAAGADLVLLSSPHRWMLVGELRGAAEPSLQAHLARLSSCDVVLVEGFRTARLPKIEVWRDANGTDWLHPDDASILGVVADRAPAGGLPHAALGDVDAAYDLALDVLGLRPLGLAPRREGAPANGPTQFAIPRTRAV